ncbi:hypothetical protein EOM09_07400 [bacterium]|nr:hypothetical protein [bacterium]
MKLEKLLNMELQEILKLGITDKDIIENTENYKNFCNYVLSFHEFFKIVKKKIKIGRDFYFDPITRKVNEKYNIKDEDIKNFKQSEIILQIKSMYI